ncbi:hypothetical protein ACEU3E_25255 [Paenibacillus oleatilyticus]|uniref:Uncharacterized protein n=1 Tax=Paenibacillus oleatilyticus TaxID=2594886 RepID=A0ABV4V7G0_9BACL
MVFKKTLSSILTATMICVSVVVPAANAEPVDNTKITVESYSIETLSDTKNAEGLYVPTGYKNVNAITEITDVGGEIKTKVSVVEDYFDQTNSFKNSVIKHEEYFNNWDSGEATFIKQSETSNTPHVQQKVGLTAKKTEKFVQVNLSNDEKTKIKKEIEGYVAKLPEAAPQKAQGLKKADLEKLKNDPEVKKAFAALSTAASIEMAGAYDNYYNHDTSTGWFRVQTLGATGHMYLRYEGSTYGSSKNANSMTQFKTAINGYDTYINQYMEAPRWPEVVGWGSTIMGLITIVAGYGSGPAGWITITLFYGGALSTFAGLTSTVYATVSRMDLSRVAAQYCENARVMNFNGGAYWENTTFSVVNGF